MKKVFSMLMVALFATAMVACGDETSGTENGGGNSNGGGSEQTTRLSNTKYYLMKPASGDGYAEHTVTFGNGNEVEYHIKWDWPMSEEYPGGEYTMRGTYTYSEVTQGSVWEASGVLTLTEVGNENHTYSKEYEADAYNLTIVPLPSAAGSLNLERVAE